MKTMLIKKLRAALAVLLVFCGSVAVVPLAGCQISEELIPMEKSVHVLDPHSAFYMDEEDQVVPMLLGYNHDAEHWINYDIAYNGRKVSGGPMLEFRHGVYYITEPGSTTEELGHSIYGDTEKKEEIPEEPLKSGDDKDSFDLITEDPFDVPYLPSKWHPDINVTVFWRAYTINKDGTVAHPLQSVEVKVPKYRTEDMVILGIHFFPDGRVKAIVTRHVISSPFYPLPKKEWPPFEVDKTLLNNIITDPDTALDDPLLSKEDIKWFKQWAPFPKGYTKGSK
jgi:hypothetical protein